MVNIVQEKVPGHLPVGEGMASRTVQDVGACRILVPVYLPRWFCDRRFIESH